LLVLGVSKASAVFAMCVNESELIEVRLALEAFAGEVFEELPRSDQRATGLRYLRGLMLDGRRKGPSRNYLVGFVREALCDRTSGVCPEWTV
jgi:hypothetical protein